MKAVKVELKSAAPITFGRHYNLDIPHEPKEKPADYEERTWFHRAHTTESGECYIPPLALKNCLSEVAKFLGEKIPGKGNATYTKNFEAGILVTDPIMLGVNIKDVSKFTLHVPSNGKRGNSSRVVKHFPMIPEWKATAIIYILDDTITVDVLKHHLEEAGRFIGMGSLRVRNCGIHGRFTVSKISAV